MIRINLLPYRAAKKKENIRRQVSIFFLSIFGVALMVFWFNSYLQGRIKAISSEIKETQVEIARYQKINQEITEIKKKLAILDTKITVIESLERNRRLPVQTLDALYTNLIPSRMWYTKIQEKGSGLSVSGVAIDENTVAGYMTRIDESSLFENVRLSSVKQYTLKSKDLKLKQFDLNFTREQPKNGAKIKGKE
jgi:type IV pilus assembly protein PilN